MSPHLGRLLASITLLALVACRGPSAGETPTSGSADRAEVTSTTQATASDDHADEQPGRLTAERRVRLGINMGPGGPAPAPLTAEQWTDAQAVACRFVLADTTYSTAEDPRTVATRRAAFATERLAEDLATSSSGGARLEALRERQVRYAGELLTVATTSVQDSIAVVDVGAAVVATSSDRPAERRLRFYRLTTIRGGDGRWLVARVEQS